MAFEYCKKTLLLLALVNYVQWSLSWPSSIRKLNVCIDFHVSHSSNSYRISADSVKVTLKQNGIEKSCVNPSTQYHSKYLHFVQLSARLVSSGLINQMHASAVTINLCWSLAVEFRSNESTLVNGKRIENRIKGILVRQMFADGEVPSGKIKGKEYLPKNVVHGACGAWSVSHSCKTDRSCYLGANGHWLNITYESPSKLNRVHDIVFK